MRFPFLSRSHHEDVVALKDTIIANRDHSIAELSNELRRLKDLIFKNNFGVQIYDTIPEPQMEPEPVLTEEQKAIEEYQDSKSYEKARLTSIAATRPSALGGELTRALERDTEQRARAANPVRQVFATARAEVTGT